MTICRDPGRGSFSPAPGDRGILYRTMTVLHFADSWLADHLLEAGLITEDQITEAAEAEADRFWDVAVERQWLDDSRIVQSLAAEFHVAPADLDRLDPGAATLVPESLAREHHVIPISADSRNITIATSDPRDLDTEQTLAFITDRDVTFEVAAPATIDGLLEELYRPERRIERLLENFGPSQVETLDDVEPLEEADDLLDAPISRLVDALVADGVRRGASDIHAEPVNGGLVVRFRVDGILREIMRLPDAAGVALVRRVKVWARLDVTDPLHPHDGRASLRVDGKNIDLRIATSPVARHREKAVIRILDKTAMVARLEDIGFASRETATLTPLFDAREGILLMTGPTGCGKTTTLNAILNHLKTGRVNIVTVEDPVEYEIDGVSQIQVNEAQGLSFANALRSVLRQDPDIVLVGEIRDTDTAQTAIQAGMTGHYVLSTLHTNDAASAVIRLQDMGLDRFKIAAVLKGVMAQRLIRRVCRQCAVEESIDSLPEFARPPADAPPISLRRGRGCQTCENTGYRGRLAVIEIMPISPRVGELINAGEQPGVLADAAREEGMNTLWESALERVWRGWSTIDEALRVLGPPTEADLPGVIPSTGPATLPTEPDGTSPDPDGAGEVTDPPTGGEPEAGPRSRGRLKSGTATRKTSKAARKATRKATRKTTRKTAKKPARKTTRKTARKRPKKTPRKASPTADSAATGTRILVADDDRLMRRLIRAVLERDGHQIEEAEDGLEALDLVESGAYDLMVLDCDMPRLDGLGVLEELRARSLTADIPVIMLTAQGEETETKALDLGAQDFLTKPLQQKSLSARVRAVLRRVAL